MGGAAHPDELIDRLTATQWAEWQAYCEIYLTPMQRADVNAAYIRQNCGQWRKIPPLKNLLIQYGGRRRPSEREMLEKCKAWAGVADAPTPKRTPRRR